MKKRGISYRDWLNRPPSKLDERPPVADPAASGTTEHAPLQPAAEHTDEQPTAEVAVPAVAIEVAITSGVVVRVEPEPAPAEAVAPAAEPSPAESARSDAPAELEEYLVFRVGRELFALPLDDVEEAIDVDHVQRIPEMGPTMLGVLTLRGASVPLYAPSVPLGVPVQANTAALIFVTARGRVALAVDDVDDVLVITSDDIRRPPLDFGDGVLVGVARRGPDLIGLLAAPALIAACRAEPALENA